MRQWNCFRLAIPVLDTWVVSIRRSTTTGDEDIFGSDLWCDELLTQTFRIWSYGKPRIKDEHREHFMKHKRMLICCNWYGRQGNCLQNWWCTLAYHDVDDIDGDDGDGDDASILMHKVELFFPRSLIHTLPWGLCWKDTCTYNVWCEMGKCLPPKRRRRKRLKTAWLRQFYGNRLVIGKTSHIVFLKSCYVLLHPWKRLVILLLSSPASSTLPFPLSKEIVWGSLKVAKAL